MIKLPQLVLEGKNFPGLGGGTLKVYTGTIPDSPEKIMLTAKEITAHLIDEYGDIDSAMFESEGDGICLNCGNIQTGVEPDAEGYCCDECEAKAVCGIENVIITYL